MSSPNEDKKDIEMEEREKKMNEENKAHDKISAADETDKEAEACGKLRQQEIKEVKPKKIPTGGILMPGFFARSKSKEKCKDDSDSQTETTELEDKDPKDDSLMSQARIKLPNPFRKSKLINEEDVERGGAEQKEKKGLLNSIRLPIVSFNKKKKDAEQNLESQTKAGLASMETLDDTDKSIDGKNDEMKNVPLDDKTDADKLEEDTTWRQKLKAYRIAISAFLAFILLVIIILAIVLPSGGNPYAAPIKDGFVQTITSCGVIEGILDDGAVAFRGIPYARPPIGDLRFRPAQPLYSYEYCWNGTYLAHNQTDTCLQIHSNGSTTGVEDCLTLDVVTPYVRYDSPLPVIVLIGADSFVGDSPGKMRPSARYARSRDVLFVRPNFRMGVLGFLSLDLLTQDAYPHTSGNYGLSDIIIALDWVKLNIEHFGGDPKAVTLFGHKAGATLVTALSTVRGADKYFARAWATSGGALYPSKTLAESDKENESFLKATNCKDVNCLREMDAEELTMAVEDTWRKPQPDLPTKDEVPENRHQWLVLDGTLMQFHPKKIWTDQEKGLSVKLVIGTTAHAAASEKLLMKHKDWSEDLIAHHVRNSVLGKLNLSREALEMYPKTYKGLSEMISDIRMVCPLLAVSKEMHNSTFYVVTQTRGEQNLADADSDVDAILGRYEPKTPEQRRYFSAIQQLFYHFVWNGKIQTESALNKVLIVKQDVLPDQNYSWCDFWINKSVVPTYAQLD